MISLQRETAQTSFIVFLLLTPSSAIFFSSLFSKKILGNRLFKYIICFEFFYCILYSYKDISSAADRCIVGKKEKMKTKPFILAAAAAVILASAGCSTSSASSAASSTSASDDTTVGEAVTESGITASDLTAAARYFKSTSESGDADEYELEYKFAKAAAELGDAEAMLYMGEMYQGEKISEAEEGDNVETAIEWWEKTAENGNGRGYTNIGLLYMHETVPGGGDDFGDIEYDPETAVEYFTKGAEMDDAKAYRYLGLAYQDGVGVEQSDEKAFENFKAAADLNDSTGKLYEADYLLDGIGTDQDVSAAIELYQELVDDNAHDKATAAYKLGTIYQEGTYVTADSEKAKSYYQIALDTATEENNTELAEQAETALASLS
jgi:TPR repeat protein